MDGKDILNLRMGPNEPAKQHADVQELRRLAAFWFQLGHEAMGSRYLYEMNRELLSDAAMQVRS